ncbi:MAG: hypothetical protein ACRCWO_12130 [Bosea sp. (in: a-proteobacteria)]
MTYAATHDLTGFRTPEANKHVKSTVPATSAPTKGFFARLCEAFMESRQLAANREIAKHRHLFERIEAARADTSDLPFTRS